jgi:hypothetical protein
MKTNLFKNATAAPAKETAPEGTTWTVGEGTLADRITEVTVLAAESKALKIKLDAAKQIVEDYAEKRWLKHWASFREPPATPVTLATAAGDAVLFVVADKTDGYAPSPKMLAALAVELEPHEIDAALRSEIIYSFNTAILGLEAKDPQTSRKCTIMQMIARRINPLLEELVTSGQIQRSDAEGLLTSAPVRVFTGDFVPSLPELCGRDASKLGRAVAALGAAIVRFIKPA